MNSKGCQGTTTTASALLSGMGEFATSRLYEWDAGMWLSSLWSTHVLSFYHLSRKGNHTVTHIQHSTLQAVYTHTRGLRVRSSLWLT